MSYILRLASSVSFHPIDTTTYIYTDSNQDRNDITVKGHMRILFLIIHWITPSRHLLRIGMLIILCLRGRGEWWKWRMLGVGLGDC
jgi:hypothetical protein